ncbi:hypothetical protein G6F62_004443 [Rhizopus arrhizus]|nr:hypothetical protein G6F62_004443 [Rhizopus arrhizus]KAG1405790.1 hypothetical protein G6F60_003376 [Rhizopus arrhizus]
MDSRKSSLESFDTAAHMIFDRDSDDTSRTTIMQSLTSKSKREYDPHEEDAPLLDELDQFELIEEEEIYKHRSNRSSSLFRRLLIKPCCGCTKRSILGGCCLLIILPILSFILFCTFYFSPTHLPSPVESKALSSSSARLLTLNIFMRPPGVKNNADDYKDERLEYIIQHVLPSYDIITFQEAFAFANRRIDKLIRQAFDQGFYYQVASPRHYPWELAGDGGLLLLSRFPIITSDRLEFPRGVHSDWLSFKGALHALVQLNNQSLVHLYTTHTQASYDNGGTFNLEDTKVRLSQFAAVHKFIAETAKEDRYPIVLMGDLNVDAAVHNASIDTPSRASSIAYTMMMDVLRGKGVDLDQFGQSRRDGQKPSYAHPWRLDGLTDVAYDTLGHHPITFGDYRTLDNGTLVPAEVVLTSHNQLLTAQSIDRLLFASRSKHEPILPTQFAVEPFLVEKNTSNRYPFTQISGKYRKLWWI